MKIHTKGIGQSDNLVLGFVDIDFQANVRRRFAHERIKGGKRVNQRNPVDLLNNDYMCLGVLADNCAFDDSSALDDRSIPKCFWRAFLMIKRLFKEDSPITGGLVIDNVSAVRTFDLLVLD